jgi:hypothetical protein
MIISVLDSVIPLPDVQYSLEILHRQRTVMTRQHLSGLDQILDLSAVQITLCQLVEFTIADLECPWCEMGYKVYPDFSPSRFV